MSANPMLVEGQQVSGFQGLGGALLEEFCYSERGDPLSVTFAGYLMPTAQEIPLVEIILTEDFSGPLGLKSAGENGRPRGHRQRGWRMPWACPEQTPARPSRRSD